MKKVLIVDDAQFMRLAIRNILERNQFEVIGEAENGTQGIQKYKELKPDIITMDLTMPEMGGIDALKAIVEYDREAKVVVVSALGQEVQIKEAIIYGAKSFIVKPIKEDHLVNTLNKILDMNKGI